MATLDFIYQGVQPSFHADKIKQLLAIPNPEILIFNIAYLRKGGVDSLSAEIALLPNPNILNCFIGIRNGVTSLQGLLELLRLGVKIYVVDTASSSIIFHPKIYLSKNASSAEIIIGSANFTHSGLYRNIEASTHVTLDMADTSDVDFLSSVIDPIMDMPTAFPDNVIEITSARDLIILLQQGRIMDERIPLVNLSPTTLPTSTQNIPTIPRMRTHTPFPPLAQRRRAVQRPPVPRGNRAISPWLLMWESKPLTERDLNIPSGNNTHATGSMTLKQGAYTHIDQRHYFYNTVFNSLTWSYRGVSLYANASFQIQCGGIRYGQYQLELKHDPRTTTASYLQSNAMTHLKWGSAKPLIANNIFLGQILKLYRSSANPTEYLIVIN